MTQYKNGDAVFIPMEQIHLLFNKDYPCCLRNEPSLDNLKFKITNVTQNTFEIRNNQPSSEGKE